MGMMDAVLSVISQYAEFGGRARRAEYWYFSLFVYIVDVVLARLGNHFALFGWVAGVFGLVVLIPKICLGVRRLHDIGKSGWYLLFHLIPLVGWIFIFVWNCTEGDRFSNVYGPDPKA